MMKMKKKKMMMMMMTVMMMVAAVTAAVAAWRRRRRLQHHIRPPLQGPHTKDSKTLGPLLESPYKGLSYVGFYIGVPLF